MRRLCAAVVLCIATLSYADNPGLHGIEAGDLDRAANPCEDFYQFANGTWRAQNPIPEYMSRWSRRWQSGEVAKEQLKQILDELAAKPNWPEGTLEQQVGDFYFACMDEPRLQALGIVPVRPLFAQIDGMKNAADVQRLIRELHDIAVPVPFAI